MRHRLKHLAKSQSLLASHLYGISPKMIFICISDHGMCLPDREEDKLPIPKCAISEEQPVKEGGEGMHHTSQMVRVMTGTCFLSYVWGG